MRGFTVSVVEGAVRPQLRAVPRGNSRLPGATS